MIFYSFLAPKFGHNFSPSFLLQYSASITDNVNPQKKEYLVLRYAGLLNGRSYAIVGFRMLRITDSANNSAFATLLADFV